MDKLLAAFVGAGGLILVILVMGLIFSLPVMLLWNYCLVGAISGVSNVGWLQAWGISILCGLLFNKTSLKAK